MKSGIFTTEFYLGASAVLLGWTMAAGCFPEGSQWERIVGAIIVGLASLGYGINRTILKENELKFSNDFKKD